MLPRSEPFLPDNPFEVGYLQSDLAPEKERDDSQLGPDESPLEKNSVSGDQPWEYKAEPTPSERIIEEERPFLETFEIHGPPKPPIIDRPGFRLEERQKMDRYEGGLSLGSDQPAPSHMLAAFTPTASDNATLVNLNTTPEAFGHNAELLTETQQTFPRELFNKSKAGHEILTAQDSESENLNYIYDDWISLLEGSSPNVMRDVHTDENKGLVIAAGYNIDDIVDVKLKEAKGVLEANDNRTAAQNVELNTLNAVISGNANVKKNFLNSPNGLRVNLNDQTQKALTANELNTRIDDYFGDDERWDVTDRQDIKVLKGLMASQIWNIKGGAARFSTKAPNSHEAAQDLALLISENTPNDTQNARRVELESQETRTPAEQAELVELQGLLPNPQELNEINNKRTELAVQLASGSKGITNIGSNDLRESNSGNPMDVLASRRLTEINKFLSGGEEAANAISGDLRENINLTIDNEIAALGDTATEYVGENHGRLNSRINKLAWYLREFDENGDRFASEFNRSLIGSAGYEDRTEALRKSQDFLDKALTIVANSHGLKEGEVFKRSDNGTIGWVEGNSADYYAPPEPTPVVVAAPEPEAAAPEAEGELYQLPASTTGRINVTDTSSASQGAETAGLLRTNKVLIGFDPVNNGQRYRVKGSQNLTMLNKPPFQYRKSGVNKTGLWVKDKEGNEFVIPWKRADRGGKNALVLGKVIVKNLNVRISPSSTAKSKGKIPKGKPVVIKEQTGDYLRVEWSHGGTTKRGWISSRQAHVKHNTHLIPAA